MNGKREKEVCASGYMSSYVCVCVHVCALSVHFCAEREKEKDVAAKKGAIKLSEE